MKIQVVHSFPVEVLYWENCILELKPKMLLTNQIAGFFTELYLEKKLMNCSNFKTFQKKKKSRLVFLIRRRQDLLPCPNQGKAAGFDYPIYLFRSLISVVFIRNNSYEHQHIAPKYYSSFACKFYIFFIVHFSTNGTIFKRQG